MRHVPETSRPQSGCRLIIAGGGTGGHLFPGIAVAQAFLARHNRNHILFINAGRPLEVGVLARLGWSQKKIPIEGIKGRGLWAMGRALLKTPWAIGCSRRMIRDFKPHAVLGVGGYAAGPVVMAAWLLGIPTALHEQNQLPGLTNRLLRRIVDRVCLTFADRTGRFDAAKTVVTGNPVRDEILALGHRTEPPRDPGSFTVLILGGSQGAHAINQAMVAAVPMLAPLQGLRIFHQTGEEDLPIVSAAYSAAGIEAQVGTFFDDMAGLYQQADLIICRAGATTVAEVTVVGRAAIFIPFPFAADDHQTANAMALVEAGAAEMIRQSDLGGKCWPKASWIICATGRTAWRWRPKRVRWVGPKRP